MQKRFRRLRKDETTRKLVRETALSTDDLLMPFFVVDGANVREPIQSMPGIARFSIDLLLKEIGLFIKAGGRGAVIFGVSTRKDLTGKYAHDAQAIVPKAIRAIKREYPSFWLVSDVCLCAYMSHGHCGVVQGKQIDNDKTLAVLAKMALAHAKAGVDMVAPSDMMDFRVGYIRQQLDKAGFKDTGIMAYAVKYSSAYYGPFREAAHSAPGFGDRRSYQMDPANSREALKEAQADIDEGADMVMVKPALAYMDIIHLLRERVHVPIVAYNVSGEYSLVKAAAKQGWIDERQIVLETLLGFKRAGADIIISYHAKDVLGWMS